MLTRRGVVDVAVAVWEDEESVGDRARAGLIGEGGGFELRFRGGVLNGDDVVELGADMVSSMLFVLVLKYDGDGCIIQVLMTMFMGRSRD